MTEEIDNLLKKSVNRLHAVKDDLRHVADLMDDDHQYLWPYALASRVAVLVDDLNKYVAERSAS